MWGGIILGFRSLSGSGITQAVCGREKAHPHPVAAQAEWGEGVGCSGMSWAKDEVVTIFPLWTAGGRWHMAQFFFREEGVYKWDGR